MKSEKQIMDGMDISLCAYNKSTGEIQVVDAEFSDQDKENIRKKIRTNVDLIATDAPFKRCFEPQDDAQRRGRQSL